MSIPSNYTFVSTFSSSVNAQAGSGVLIGTPINGAAIVNSQLDLAHNDVRYVKYQGIGNVDNPQTGAVKFIYTPNYSGAPASLRVFWSIMADQLSQLNLIELYHNTTGHLHIYINSSVGGTICAASYGLWEAVAGTDYEIEFDYDITAGVNRLFIDGALFGTLTGAGTRNTNINAFNIGTDFSTTYASDFSIKDLIVFDTVQHTAAYTPGYCLNWSEPTIPNQCNVYGFIERIDYNPVSGVRIRATANSLYNLGNLQVYIPTVTTVSGSTGYWELNLINSIDAGVNYKFEFIQNNVVIKEYDDVVVPADDCVYFNAIV
jgi:hypothetical protein